MMSTDAPALPIPPSTGLSVLLKGILLGDYAVGKSSLFEHYLCNRGEYTPTIGVDFYSCQHRTTHGHRVRLQLWDTAGQERFRGIVASYVRNVYIVYLVFDVGRRYTFNHLISWKQLVHERNGGVCQFVLVANKVDLPPDSWAVTVAEIEAFVANNGICATYYVSATQPAGTRSIERADTDKSPSPVICTGTVGANPTQGVSVGRHASTPIRNMFKDSLSALMEHLGDGSACDPLQQLQTTKNPDRRLVVACSDCCLANGGSMLRPVSESPTHGGTNDGLHTPPGSPTDSSSVPSKGTSSDPPKDSSRDRPCDSTDHRSLDPWYTQNGMPICCNAVGRTQRAASTDHTIQCGSLLSMSNNRMSPAGSGIRMTSETRRGDRCGYC